MTATNHALTGVAIAVAVHSPAALPLALAAHFAMDAIPHSNLKLREIWGDILFSGLLTIAAALLLSPPISIWLILGSAFAGVSPDLVWGWRYFKLKDLKKIVSEPWSLFSEWHQKIQWSETRRGIIIEAVWFGLVLAYILLRYHEFTTTAL